MQVLSAGRKEIEDLVESYLSATRAKRDNPECCKPAARHSFRAATCGSGRERIIVVPDGVLHLLPFDTLRDSSGTLVLESHTVSYIPAATVLRVLRNEKPMETRKACASRRWGRCLSGSGTRLGKACETSRHWAKAGARNVRTFGTTVYDLPQTREEVLAASKILGNDSVLLVGRDATETAFKADTAN